LEGGVWREDAATGIAEKLSEKPKKLKGGGEVTVGGLFIEAVRLCG